MNIARQFVRYASVGAIGTLAHYGVLIAMVQSHVTGPLIGSSLGFVVGAIVNYVLNYRFTFRSQRAHREAFARFMTVALIGLAINSLTIGLLTGPAELHYLAGQVVATGAVLVATFVTNRVWTFPERSDAPRG